MKALAKATSMGKFARYSDGSEDGVKASDAEVSYASADDVRSAKSDSDSAPAKSTDFKSAFASARKGGASTFEWNGKKYTTELASAKPAAKPSARSASSGVDFKRESAKLNAAGKGDYTPPQRSIMDNPAAARALVDRGLRMAEGERAVKAYKAQKLANGGVVQRAAVKSHGKAC